MKRIGFILLLAIALCLGGCQKDNRREDVNNWCMEDLKFYDYEGKPAWELTIDNRVISLRDKEGLQTYRGVMIGDDAKEVLSQYNMDDFIYEIVGNLNSKDQSKSYDQAWALTEEYKDVAPEEMLGHLAEISDFDVVFHYLTRVYLVDGKFYRLSEMEDRNIYDYAFWIQFYIKDEKIDNVKITIWG